METGYAKVITEHLGIKILTLHRRLCLYASYASGLHPSSYESATKAHNYYFGLQSCLQKVKTRRNSLVGCH